MNCFDTSFLLYGSNLQWTMDNGKLPSNLSSVLGVRSSELEFCP
ncbi:hypothetical protein CWATWH8502_1248 [Crocosphaera watsonii WH 8502]|uniref:Uncharacterized protein n=4 Tax=Crocosphaera watsonii TaxID=263511 RepID=T2JJN6_CROWT|nr:hypothetical protein CWATWH8502_1248 [Crocosphaera watsonii WH 8502]CCQ59502.1 hypothetical protein CWATWH0005_2116 [Crocosphaera watsonii WH 0005]CCQ64573.1 hypothetical protein CWATWH0401_2091 [Crocosphaera watsonii WH 0401]CCQ64697.1 hypothetical protein CWATWH0402_5264 [Crocosphaera watsonii WH 0402]